MTEELEQFLKDSCKAAQKYINCLLDRKDSCRIDYEKTNNNSIMFTVLNNASKTMATEFCVNSSLIMREKLDTNWLQLFLIANDISLAALQANYCTAREDERIKKQMLHEKEEAEIQKKVDRRFGKINEAIEEYKYKLREKRRTNNN